MERQFLPINGQKLCEYANMRFGWKRFAANGCSILAIYNALGLTGRAASVEEIHSYFHAWYRPRFFGLHPWRIKRYFLKQKIEFQAANTAEELHRHLKNGGVAVITYWNRRLFGRLPNIFRGAHTVALRYDEKYMVYNRYSNRDRVYEFESLDECLSGHVYMKGFVLTL